LQLKHAEISALHGEEPSDNTPRENNAAAPYVREGEKVGRNDPCPCGSGKKYKQCHGRLV